MPEFLGGLVVEIMGSLIDKAGTYLRQIMRQHQGDIQVMSEVGRGTILTLIFLD